MLKLARSISALLFLAGCVAMIAGATIAWLYVVVGLAEIHVTFGFLGFIASFYLFWRYQQVLRTP